MTTDARTAELCHLIKLVVTSIADDPAEIDITPVDRGRRTFVQVQASQRDRGKLIGRDGRIADALREYVRAYQRQHGGLYGLDVIGRDI